jgi:hypothetical protein
MPEGRKPSTPAPCCACGCGQLVTNWNWGHWKRYIPNHYHPPKGHLSGPRNPRWKGWTTLSPGYVLVKAPTGHPRTDHRGYVKRAVLVLEEKLGRYLTPDEHVHHRNHEVADDRPENLEALNAYEHSRLHIPDRLAAIRRTNAVPRGSRHGGAKLTEADIPRVFAMRASGLSQQAIADHFGVYQTLISQILLRQRWKHVDITKQPQLQ